MATCFTMLFQYMLLPFRLLDVLALRLGQEMTVAWTGMIVRYLLVTLASIARIILLPKADSSAVTAQRAQQVTYATSNNLYFYKLIFCNSSVKMS